MEQTNALEQVKPLRDEAKAERGEKASLQLEYVNVPSINETFADSVHELMFDGQTFRLEFCVTRMETPRDAQAGPRGRRYTTCRLVLPASAALDLSGKLGRVLSAMLKQGMANKAPGDATAAGVKPS